MYGTDQVSGTDWISTCIILVQESWWWWWQLRAQRLMKLQQDDSLVHRAFTRWKQSPFLVVADLIKLLPPLVTAFSNEKLFSFNAQSSGHNLGHTQRTANNQGTSNPKLNIKRQRKVSREYRFYHREKQLLADMKPECCLSVQRWYKEPFISILKSADLKLPRKTVEELWYVKEH